MTQKEWIIKTPDPALISLLSENLKISKIAAAVLVNRGISTHKQAQEFLYPNVDDMSNPFLLPDMKPAVDRIRKAVDCKEKILVYGDRDVDGVASISIMVRTLKSLGGEVQWFIPSDEGYGLHKEILERYVKEGVSLVITVDCGISSIEEVEFAKQIGVDVVITDHHEPPSTGLPKAEAVVDPKRQDSSYPFSDLAGCAVSFKVCEALMHSFGRYYDRELVFLSIKTESAEPKMQEIREIGCVKAKNGIIIDTYQTEASSKEAISLLFEFIGKSPVVVHNAESVIELLQYNLGKYFDRQLNNEIIDITAVSKNYSGSIADLAVSLGLEDADAIEELNLVSSPQTDCVTTVVADSSAILDNIFTVKAKDEAALINRIFTRLKQQNDLRMKFFRENNLDLMTLGTIADIMPVLCENRILVKHGLKLLPQSRKVGVQLLLERCMANNNNSVVSAKNVSWNLTPLLNAAGRRGKAGLAAELLLTEDSYQANKLLNQILELNSERKELQTANLGKFMELVLQQCDVEKDKILIITAEGLEHGVTGIIASQIVRQYGRPAVLLIKEGGEAVGAARSIEGFDITSAFSRVRDILIKYGGHSRAAGLTISADKIDEFKIRLKEITDKEISPELLKAVVEIDTEVDGREVNLALLDELLEFEPYGAGNPNPVFSLRKMKVLESSRIGTDGNHLKLRIAKDGGKTLSAVGWGLGSYEDFVNRHSEIDLAVQIELNIWNDRKNLQLLIVDMKPSVT